MLHTLFMLWAFAVAVPATLLAVVVAVQGAAGLLRRVSATSRPSTAGLPAEA